MQMRVSSGAAGTYLAAVAAALTPAVRLHVRGAAGAPRQPAWRRPRACGVGLHTLQHTTHATCRCASSASSSAAAAVTPAAVHAGSCASMADLGVDEVAVPAATAPSPPTTAATALRQRFRCPECGKRFLCESNLVGHRSTRHGIQVASASELVQARLAAENAQLARELEAVQARVRQLREGGGRGAGTSRPAVAGGSAPAGDDRKLDAAGAAEGTESSEAAAAATSSAYPSAVPTGRLMDVDAETAAAWRASGRGLGTGISFVQCVGTVRGAVELGTLRGLAHAVSAPTTTPLSSSASSPPLSPTEPAAAGAAGAALTGPRVLQFAVEVHGYRERRPGQLKMYRAHMLVRYVVDQPYHAWETANAATSPASGGTDESTRVRPARLPAFKVEEGDVVQLTGHYALHSTYDMISKQSIENVVLEADHVGLLRRAPLPSMTAAGVPPVSSTNNAEVQVAEMAVQCEDAKPSLQQRGQAAAGGQAPPIAAADVSARGDRESTEAQPQPPESLTQPTDDQPRASPPTTLVPAAATMTPQTVDTAITAAPRPSRAAPTQRRRVPPSNPARKTKRAKMRSGASRASVPAATADSRRPGRKSKRKLGITSTAARQRFP